MRIGFIVDGDSEVDALPRLLKRIHTPHELLPTVVRGLIHPKSAPVRIARAAAEACAVLARKRPDLVVVALDLEDRTECPGELAALITRLTAERISRLGLLIQVAVVLKVTKFENWLVADLGCLRAMPRQFPSVQHVIGSVPSGNADGIDAHDLLKRAAGPRRSYHKVKGAVAICTHLDPGRAALNSRSFRRLLRVLEDERYADQSRLPNQEV